MSEEVVLGRPGIPTVRPRYSWYAHPGLHLVLNTVLVTVSQLLLKKGAMAPAPAAPGWLAWTGVAALVSIWVVAGILCYLASFANWLYLLRTVPLHIASPVTNLSQALIPLGAWVLFGERFGANRALGFLLIILGAWFIARPLRSNGSSP